MRPVPKPRDGRSVKCGARFGFGYGQHSVMLNQVQIRLSKHVMSSDKLKDRAYHYFGGFKHLFRVLQNCCGAIFGGDFDPGSFHPVYSLVIVILDDGVTANLYTLPGREHNPGINTSDYASSNLANRINNFVSFFCSE